MSPSKDEACTMALSRAVRVGIVASSLWLVGFCVYTGNEVIETGAQVQSTHYDLCVQDMLGRSASSVVLKKCADAAYDDRIRHVGVVWSNALPFAFILLGLAWAVGLTLVYTSRWIARGD